MNNRTAFRIAAAGLVLAIASACSSPPPPAPVAPADTYGNDRAAIEELQARYMFGLDFRDPEVYANTFTEDGVLDYGAGKLTGREAIRNMVAGIREREGAERAKATLRPAAGRHNITNISIVVNGDTATSTAYWFQYGNDNPERSAQLNSFGHYEDEMRKVDGQWLFSLRKIYNEQVAEWAWEGQGNPSVTPGPGPRMRAPAAPAGS